jgi:hypothetical protein
MSLKVDPNGRKHSTRTDNLETKRKTKADVPKTKLERMESNMSDC